MSREFSRETLQKTFWIAVVVSVVLALIPFGNFVLYPFSLLGTWAHEMGHGLGAIVVGGDFQHLELYSSLGGVAYSSRPDNPFANAFVAAAGLIGPAIAGGAIIALGSKKKAATWIMDVLAVLLLASAVIWIRNLFGFVSIVVLGLAAAAVAHVVSELVEVVITQFIGIRLAVEALSSVDYMFTKQFSRGGQVMNSDTQSIAEALFLPYWIWGGLIAVLCMAILGVSYFYAWGRE